MENEEKFDFEFTRTAVHETTNSSTTTKKTGGYNKIFYGCPGCGKSHNVDKMLSSVDEKNVFRVTFHPEYSNFDFVGQLIPKVGKDGDKETVTYEFNKGPFVEALERALDPTNNDMVFLVIEEINRGNAAAIFGDLFQLLDRIGNDGNPKGPKGQSTYKINNLNIQRQLAKDGLANEDEKIYIPSNLTILATMNTSDQNVFTLDTAFKRRWEFEHVSNEFTSADKIGDKYIPGANITWKTFVKNVNKKIASKGIEDSISDDKRIGKWFVSEDLLCDGPTQFKDGEGNIDEGLVDKARKFGFKVLEYIWNDVAKYDAKAEWFDISPESGVSTLEELIEKFVDTNVNNSISIFINDLF